MQQKMHDIEIDDEQAEVILRALNTGEAEEEAQDMGRGAHQTLLELRSGFSDLLRG